MNRREFLAAAVASSGSAKLAEGRKASGAMLGSPNGHTASNGAISAQPTALPLDLPMTPRWIKGREAQAGHVALMYGPQIFCLNRARHPELKDIDLRLVVIDPETLEGPVADDSVRPGGLAFRVKAWQPGSWYLFESHTYTLSFSEFPVPDGEATFFMVPNPDDSRFVADELLTPKV